MKKNILFLTLFIINIVFIYATEEYWIQKLPFLDKDLETVEVYENGKLISVGNREIIDSNSFSFTYSSYGYERYIVISIFDAYIILNESTKNISKGNDIYYYIDTSKPLKILKIKSNGSLNINNECQMPYEEIISFNYKNGLLISEYYENVYNKDLFNDPAIIKCFKKYGINGIEDLPGDESIIYYRNENNKLEKIEYNNSNIENLNMNGVSKIKYVDNNTYIEEPGYSFVFHSASRLPKKTIYKRDSNSNNLIMVKYFDEYNRIHEIEFKWEGDRLIEFSTIYNGKEVITIKYIYKKK